MRSGWELWNTLSFFSESFKIKKGGGGEGENKMVLVDFDGVLASGKTLDGVLFREVVGLKGLSSTEGGGHKNDKSSMTTALHIWGFYTWEMEEEEEEEEEGEDWFGWGEDTDDKKTEGINAVDGSETSEVTPFPGCPRVLETTKQMRKQLEERGGLKECGKVVDLEWWREVLEKYQRDKLKESGLTVLYGGRGKWKGIGDCYVVDEEVGRELGMELGWGKVEMGNKKKRKKREASGKKTTKWKGEYEERGLVQN